VLPPAVRSRPLALVLALIVVGVLAGCRATTIIGEPEPTPTDMIGLAVELQRRGVTVTDVVSGDAGCSDPDLVPASISFRASGLDQVEPVTIRLFIFRNDAAYQRQRAKVDGCASSFVTDPETFEALDASPFVAVGQGPWAPGLKLVLRETLETGAGGPTDPSG
jgi:hypothetical protein